MIRIKLLKLPESWLDEYFNSQGEPLEGLVWYTKGKITHQVIIEEQENPWDDFVAVDIVEEVDEIDDHS